MPRLNIKNIHVMTAQDLRYMKIINFKLFIAGRRGEKKSPNQTIPWLLIKCRTFSATLNSPYSGKVDSISQHHQAENVPYKEVYVIEHTRAVSNPETTEEIDD